MNEMLKTIEPKSDQLNADDLLGGRTRTIKISRVSILAGEQPVALHYEGDNGKPYKPCKSMRRVVVTIWGSDANLYVGRRMTLYRDDNVMFGGVAVGGIRISHISGVDKECTIALTASRAIRKPFTVRPLAEEQEPSNLIAAGTAAAEAGMAPLEAFWKGLSAAERQKLGQDKLEAWKHLAATGTDLSQQFPARSGAGADGGSSVGAADRRDMGGESSPPPMSDSRLNELLSEGRAAATNGLKKFNVWYGRLNAPDAELFAPHVEALRKVAATADKERT